LATKTDWADSLRREQLDQIQQYCLGNNITWVSVVGYQSSADQALQKAGVDLIINDRKIQLKNARFDGGVIQLEVDSVGIGKRDGWVYHTQADQLWWYYEQQHRIIWWDWPRLQQWFVQNETSILTGGKLTEQSTNRGGQIWYSRLLTYKRHLLPEDSRGHVLDNYNFLDLIKKSLPRN